MSILSTRFRYGLPLIVSAGLVSAVACGDSGDGDGAAAGTPGVSGSQGVSGGGAGGSAAGTPSNVGGSAAGTPAVVGGGGSGGTGTASGGASAGTAGKAAGAGTGGAVAGSGGKSGGTGGSSAGAGGTIVVGGSGGAPTGGTGGGSLGGEFKLTSPNLEEGAKFGTQYTCNGANVGKGDNPGLKWTGVPEGTKSFAVTFIDTTLGDNSQFGQHWAIWNIPWDAATGKVAEIPAGAPSKSLGGDLSTAKQSGAYLAPCSQTQGQEDQYEFTIYALNTANLNVSGTTVASALKAIYPSFPQKTTVNPAVIGTAKLSGHSGYKGM